jgi:ATP adenylyltransferase/5',5'''-P-1,P-4-tetraphosphate phosphorylase II
MQDKIISLFEEQLQTWPLAAKGYRGLNDIRTKTFDFGAYAIKVQFNPARAVSTLAKLDAKSIEARPCFLCAANRPVEQKYIEFKGCYDILVNPFPICDKHFTIASKKHEPQAIKGRINDMLELAQAMPDFIILYNGPKAGASAPDHFHFQAGNVEFFDNQVDIFKKGLIEKQVISSQLKSVVVDEFDTLYNQLQTDEQEPMMNLFCQYKPEGWVLTVYPRKQHRPMQFFLQGKEQIMVSPGAIDMTGILIVAREEDFEKITKEDIQDIFRQVS